jgi:hypothetical protein
MKDRGVVLLLFALGCTYYTPPKPADEWHMDGPAPTDARRVLDIARAASPCTLPRGYDYGGIHWTPAGVPISCRAEPSAAGCWDGMETFISGYRIVAFPSAIDSALIHEVGHYLWAACGKNTLDHPPEFMAWIEATRRAAR